MYVYAPGEVWHEEVAFSVMLIADAQKPKVEKSSYVHLSAGLGQLKEGRPIVPEAPFNNAASKVTTSVLFAVPKKFCP